MGGLKEWRQLVHSVSQVHPLQLERESWWYFLRRVVLFVSNCIGLAVCSEGARLMLPTHHRTLPKYESMDEVRNRSTDLIKC